MKTRVELVDADSYKQYLRSPEEAYILSRLESAPMNLSELRKSALGKISESDFTDILNRYRDLRLISFSTDQDTAPSEEI